MNPGLPEAGVFPAEVFLASIIAVSPMRSTAGDEVRIPLTLRRFVCLNRDFTDRKSRRITLNRAVEVSDSEDTSIVFPPSSFRGIFENSSMLFTGPEELMENHGRIR